MENDTNDLFNFVKFNKINIIGNSGVGKKTLLKEIKKFNNPQYNDKKK